MSAMEQIQLAFPSPRKLFTPAVTTIIMLTILGFTLIHHVSKFTIEYLAINPQTDEMMTGLVDVYLADLKCGTDVCAKALLGADNYLQDWLAAKKK